MPADSSAGKFWQPGGLKRFVAESAEHLARLTGDPGAAKAFANMPVVIVGYSGGFVPAAWSLEVGGLAIACAACSCSTRFTANWTRFASWIVNQPHRLFRQRVYALH